jgi:hypothetical protein
VLDASGSRFKVQGLQGMKSLFDRGPCTLCLIPCTCLYSAINSLVAKTVLVSAIRALPCDAVTRHSPYIFLHTSLADKKAAAAGPAKGKFFLTAMAPCCFHPAALAPVGCSGFGVCHFKIFGCYRFRLYSNIILCRPDAFLLFYSDNGIELSKLQVSDFRCQVLKVLKPHMKLRLAGIVNHAKDVI